MTLTSMPAPIKFYQVKATDHGKSIEYIAERFNIPASQIDRENPDPKAMLENGEMLIIPQ